MITGNPGNMSAVSGINIVLGDKDAHLYWLCHNVTEFEARKAIAEALKEAERRGVLKGREFHPNPTPRQR